MTEVAVSCRSSVGRTLLSGGLRRLRKLLPRFVAAG
jgi:hypothetical protein